MRERVREGVKADFYLHCTLDSIASGFCGVSCMGPVLLLMLTACAVEHPRCGSNVPSCSGEVAARLQLSREHHWRSVGGLYIKCVLRVSELVRN